MKGWMNSFLISFNLIDLYITKVTSHESESTNGLSPCINKCVLLSKMLHTQCFCYSVPVLGTCYLLFCPFYLFWSCFFSVQQNNEPIC